MKSGIPVSATFGLALLATTGNVSAGGYLSTPQALDALGQAATFCDNGAWRNSMCNSAFYNSAYVLAYDYLDALDKAGASLEDQYRVIAACPPSPYAYQDEQIAQTCAKAIMDTAEATGIEPDPIQYELLVYGHDAMNGDLEIQKQLEEVLDYYIPPKDPEFSPAIDIPGLNEKIETATLAACPEESLGMKDTNFTCVNAIWMGMRDISSAIDQYIVENPQLKNAKLARADLRQCQEATDAMMVEFERAGGQASLSLVDYKLYQNKGITTVVSCMTGINKAENNIELTINNKAQNILMLNLNALMEAALAPAAPPRLAPLEPTVA